MAVKNVKRGLGKGLDSIIPAKSSFAVTKEREVSFSEEQSISEGQVIHVNITQVEPNRNQPRKSFDEDSLLELAESIKLLTSLRASKFLITLTPCLAKVFACKSITSLG